MKKLLALILAAALALSLVACGGGSGAGDTKTPNDMPSTEKGDTTSTDTPSGGGEDSTQAANSMTKEEMLETAEEVTIPDMRQAVAENQVRAKEQYCNTPILVSGEVYEIKNDRVILNGEDTTMVLVDVYLQTNDLIELSTNQRISVVGICSDIEKSGQTHYVMDTAYLAGTKFELSGKLSGVTGKFQVFNDDGTSTLNNITFADGVDTSQYIDEFITVSCEIKHRPNGFIEILNAEIIGQAE